MDVCVHAVDTVHLFSQLLKTETTDASTGFEPVDAKKVSWVVSTLVSWSQRLEWYVHNRSDVCEIPWKKNPKRMDFPQFFVLPCEFINAWQVLKIYAFQLPVEFLSVAGSIPGQLMGLRPQRINAMRARNSCGAGPCQNHTPSETSFQDGQICYRRWKSASLLAWRLPWNIPCIKYLLSHYFQDFVEKIHTLIVPFWQLPCSCWMHYAVYSF